MVQVSSKLQSVTDAINHVFWTVVVTILLILLLTYLYTLILMTNFL
eukprot:SAG31_NODE_25296_length_464_cov_0.926027_2_plen_45_part_01